MSKYWALILGILFILAYLVQGAFFIEANSQTFDEAVHLTAGYSYLTTADFRMNPEHPPFVKLLWALPVWVIDHPEFSPSPELWKEPHENEWQIADQFMYGDGTSADKAKRLLRTARWVNLLLGASLLALIGWWSYRLWGPLGGITSLGLAAFDPTLIAHACVLTTDVGNALFIFLFCYLLWEYVAAPSQRLLTLLGFALGLALATKLTAVLLIGILGVVLVIHCGLGGTFPFPGEEGPPSKSLLGRLTQAAGPLRRIGFIAGLVLVATYFVIGFRSWAEGLRHQIDRVVSDQSFFFLGETSSRGWLSYFPVALALKTPIATSALMVIGLIAVRGKRNIIFLLAPPAIYFAAMMQGRVDLGVRIILPVLPFLLVAAGRVPSLCRQVGPVVATVCIGLTAWSSLATAPHQLAYFNELIGGPDQGHRYLGDSNLDWGQDLEGLHDYLQTQGNPVIYLAYFGTARAEAYGIRYRYLDPGARFIELPKSNPEETPRFLAISMTTRQGIYLKDQSSYPWLRYKWLDSRKPVAIIGHSIEVYDLTNDADARQRLEQLSPPITPKPPG